MPLPAPRTVLVVEDDADSREILVELLHLEGYLVVQASDGVEALAQLQRALPDAILLDLQMPHVDGYAVLRWLKANAAGVPVAIISAEVEAPEGHPLFAKPIELSALRLWLADVLHPVIAAGRP
jgi:CheY-like chemotaxis protein